MRAQLHLALGVAPARASVWLLGPPPSPGTHDAAWTLVCLAAVAAMDHGRALLWGLHVRAGRSPVALSPEQVAAASASAVARFWHVLQDFAADSEGPSAAWQLPPGHPFLAQAPGARVLHVRLPPTGPRT